MPNKKIQDIPYMEILKKSFRLAWKNKFLWWFGLFIALSTPGSLNINFPANSDEISLKNNDQARNVFNSINNFFHQYLLWIILGAAIIFAIFVAFYILGKIARGALIKSVNEINSGEPAGFKLGFADGKKYLWKILGLDILLSLSLTIIIFIVISPSIILFIYHAYIAGILIILLAIFFVVALAVLVSFLRNYGHLYIVLANLPIWHSIESAYALFRKNLWPSALMALINTGAGFIIGIPLLILLFVFIMLGLAGGFLIYTLLQWIGVIIFAVIALLIFMAIAFLVRSFMEVFFQTVWILFFQEIATQPKAEEIIAEPVLETKPEVKPAEGVNMIEN